MDSYQQEFRSFSHSQVRYNTAPCTGSDSEWIPAPRNQKSALRIFILGFQNTVPDPDPESQTNVNPDSLPTYTLHKVEVFDEKST
jgi:hypothetical protein